MLALTLCYNALVVITGTFLKVLTVVYLQLTDNATDVVDLIKQQDNQIQKTLFLALIPVVVAFSFIKSKGNRKNLYPRMGISFSITIQYF